MQALPNQVSILFKDIPPKASRLLSRLSRMEGREFIYKFKNVRIQGHEQMGDTVKIDLVTLPVERGKDAQSAKPKGKEFCLDVELDKLHATLSEFLQVDC